MTKKSIMPQPVVGLPNDPSAVTPGKYPTFEEGQAAVDAFMGKAEAKKSDTQGDTQPALDDEIQALTTAIDKAKESPELTLQDILKEHKISNSEAEEMVDCLMQGKEVIKTYSLTKRFKVTFRSRLLKHQNQTLDALEQYNPVLPMTTGSLIAQHNLAQSIVGVAYESLDKSAGHNTPFVDSSLEDKLKWVSGLSENVGRLITSKLSQFDNMLLGLMDEGIISNF